MLKVSIRICKRCFVLLWDKENAMGFFTVLAIAVGLAMDSFAVSIAGGISLKDFKTTDVLRTGLFMGIAQSLFFCLGFFVALSVCDLISAYDHWIVFVLLMGIGLKMILEHKKESKDRFVDLRRKRILGTLAMVTSIDALAVGVSFSFLQYNVALAAIIIGLVSFLFAGSGVVLGFFFSKIKRFPTYIIGGGLLIAIGTKILIEHLVNHI